MTMTAEKTVRELALENTAAPEFSKSWASTTAAGATNRWTKPAGHRISRSIR